MAIIALPTTAGFLRKIEWALDRPAQVNVSGYTGRRQVVANPWHGKWSASCEFVPIIGETNVRQWRAFFAQLKGQINTFRLPSTEGAQNAYTPTVNGSVAAGVATLSATGFPASVTAMFAGQMLTLNDQLCVLTADVATNGSGVGAMTFEPPLRAAATNGTAIEVRNPTCLVALTDSSFGYSVDPGKIYGMAMKVEEAF